MAFGTRLGRTAMALGAALLVTLTGCSNMKIEDFAGKEPRLQLEEYFAGHSRAWGIFEDRFGNLRREFTVDIQGSWDGEVLTLEEDFVFADGETDRRVWRIRKIDEHHYEGRADDVIGVAEGVTYGNALTWSYQVDLKMGDRTTTVRFNDWMWLQDENVLVNRAEVTKWGIAIGEVTIFFHRLDAAKTTAATSQSANSADIVRAAE